MYNSGDVKLSPNKQVISYGDIRKLWNGDTYNIQWSISPNKQIISHKLEKKNLK